MHGALSLTSGSTLVARAATTTCALSTHRPRPPQPRALSARGDRARVTSAGVQAWRVVAKGHPQGRQAHGFRTSSLLSECPLERCCADLTVWVSDTDLSLVWQGPAAPLRGRVSALRHADRRGAREVRGGARHGGENAAAVGGAAAVGAHAAAARRGADVWAIKLLLWRVRHMSFLIKITQEEYHKSEAFSICICTLQSYGFLNCSVVAPCT